MTGEKSGWDECARLADDGGLGQLLEELLAHPELPEREREAFEKWLGDLRAGRRVRLSRAQAQWARDAAAGLGIADEQAANLFSGMALDRQKMELERASGTKLFYEREGYRRPLRPPGRGR